MEYRILRPQPIAAKLLIDPDYWAWEQSIVSGSEMTLERNVETLLGWDRIWALEAVVEGSRNLKYVAWATANGVEAQRGRVPAVYLNNLIMTRSAGGLDAGTALMERLIAMFPKANWFAQVPKQRSRVTAYYMLLNLGFSEIDSEGKMTRWVFLER